MNYNIIKAINTSVNNAFLGQERYYVLFAEGPRVGTRENIAGYDTEEKAKRRIRDLKRKELSEGVHGNLVTPSERDHRETEAEINADLISAAIANDEGEVFHGSTSELFAELSLPLTSNSECDVFVELNAAGSPVLFTKPATIIRPMGVYPAVPKRAYRRQWNA